MKKSGKFLAALFLFSSVLVAPLTSPIAYAEDLPTAVSETPAEEANSIDPEESATTANESETTSEDTDVVNEVAGENATTEADDSLDVTSTDPANEESTNTDTETETNTDFETAKTALQAKIAEAKTYLVSPIYSAAMTETLASTISSAEALLASSTSTADDLTLATTTLTILIQALKDIAIDPIPADIVVSDKTMYVGDYIDEDMVLGWANFVNAEGFYCGFEVIGAPIYYTASNNQLAVAGTYTIRYYIKSSDSETGARALSADGGATIMTKDITLTVLEGTTLPPVEPTAPIQTQVVAETPKTEAKPKAELPQTGETNSAILVAMGGASILAAAYVLNKKKLRD